MLSTTRVSRHLGLAALVCAGLLLTAGTASAQSGGTVAPGGETSAAPTGPVGKAKLTKKGKAIAPANAPTAVVKAIAAGNRIRKKPYIYGGGHASFESKGYDCSGAVSYVLRGAGLIKSPMPSGPYMKWGLPGAGRWITVYANGGHAYMTVAGLRFDTSAMGSGGNGPRWRAAKRSPRGFAVRHAEGF
ncbi:MAG: NlpC/P60 family protein [Actinobacteria bacterium]|nr:NlpC/P60 family protein [Actinomycetota bacterium]